MQLPTTSTTKTQRITLEEFGGINTRMRIGDGEFLDTINMTAKHYPLLASESAYQKARETLKYDGSCVGSVYINETLFYLAEEKISLTGKYSLTLLNNSVEHPIDISLGDNYDELRGERKIITFGVYILIFPDKLYLNTTDYKDCGKFDNEFVNIDRGKHYNTWYVITPCDSDGNGYKVDTYGSNEPQSVSDGHVWFDTTESAIKVYSSAYAMWTHPNIYHKYRCLDIAKGFKKDDSIKIVRLGNTEQTTSIVQCYHNDNPTGKVEHNVPIDADYIVVAETAENKIMWNKWDGDESLLYNQWRNMICIERKTPQMDYVCECNGRVWGCRNGETEVYNWKEYRTVKQLVPDGYDNSFEAIPIDDDEEITEAPVYWLYDDNYNRLDDDAHTVGTPYVEVYKQNGVYGYKLNRNGYTKDSVNLTIDYRVKTKSVYNEIYASKQQNFKCWDYFQGTAMDSYTLSLGHAGKFTGAINYNGRPLFTKEDRIYEIYGNYPAQYQLQENCVEGTQDGANEAMTVYNGYLYYKGINGIYRYASSIPQKISDKADGLADSTKIIGAYNDLLFCYTGKALLEYDISRNIWHKKNVENEDIQQLIFMPNGIVARTNSQVISIDGSVLGSTEKENDKPWSATTGLLGLSIIEEKYVSRITLRYKGTATVEISYDNKDDFRPCVNLTGDTNITTFNIIPRRCGTFRLRISGVGEFYLYAFSLTLMQGSDTRNVNI